MSSKQLWLRPATCLLAMGLMVLTAQAGVTLTTLVSFSGTNGVFPGANPYCGLTVGPDGNFYGTTSQGGSNNLGTVFQLTPGGVFTSLMSFDGTNGANPYAALTPAANGLLYGTTFTGGGSNWGTIYLISTNGAFTNLYSFTGSNNPSLGANPSAPLTPDGDGNFYGTTDYGGAYTNNAQGGYGYGTIFKLGSDGTVSVPVFFNNTNGARSTAGMVLGRDGNFYGTATWGGIGIPGNYGYGTVFRLSPDGTFTNMYKFTGFSDGGQLYAGLVQGNDGCLYGGTFGGGAYGYGTLFKVGTNGAFTLLHTFTFSDSGWVYGGLMEGNDGNVYGTTYGAYGGYGSIFKLTPGGAFTNLVFFNIANGAHPDGVLVQGPDNNFYGTTAQGGAYGLGTIFRLSVPLTPVIETIAQTNGVVTFTWGAVAGQAYQPQYSTDLTSTNWNNLSKPFAAVSGTVTSVDSTTAGSAQRFYRVVLMP